MVVDTPVPRTRLLAWRWSLRAGSHGIVDDCHSSYEQAADDHNPEKLPGEGDNALEVERCYHAGRSLARVAEGLLGSANSLLLPWCKFEIATRPEKWRTGPHMLTRAVSCGIQENPPVEAIPVLRIL